MCVISAFTVETSAVGFAPCTWPAHSREQAERKAESLSQQYRDDGRYPNAFWVIDSGGAALGKYFSGQRYKRGQAI